MCGKAKEVDGELKSNDETGKQRRTKEDKEAGGKLKRKSAENYKQNNWVS